MSLLSAASVLAGPGIAITTQQRIHVGDAIKFQWGGGTPPYTLKVLLNNTVVSQNEGWTGNSVQWRSTPEQVPVGTKIKIRISDSEGQMVLSDATKVIGDLDESGAGSFEPTASPAKHDSSQDGKDEGEGGESKGEGTGSGYDHGMDDPHQSESRNEQTFGIGVGVGAEGMTLSMGHSPAVTTPTVGTMPGMEELSPTGQAGWDASGVDGNTLLPPTGTASASGGLSGAAGSDLATSASASASATGGSSAAAAATAAKSVDVANSASTDATAVGTTGADDATAAASSASSTSTSEASTSDGSSNTTLYIGIAVIVVLLAAALGGFFYWRVHSLRRRAASRHRKQAAADEAHAAASKKRSKRNAKRASHGTGSSDEDEEKLVGDSKGDHYGSSDEGSDLEQPPKVKGKSSRSATSYHDDDLSASDAYGSEPDAKPAHSLGRSRR
ncbi:hypothetical protein JCM10908_003953 [Rhodotorula pacifica]|uniref:uncharacterized protein n=1 Tax=Rhodotorula pacifica TaxID=1495444 RepID=UPI003173AAB6